MSDLPLRLGLGLFFAVGLALLVGGGLKTVGTAGFLRDARRATATVVRVNTEGSGRHLVRRVDARFRAESGEEVETSFAGSDVPAASEGTPLEVLYDPARPARARLDTFSDLWLVPTLLGGVGLVLVLLALGAFLAFRTPAPRRDLAAVAARAGLEDEVREVLRAEGKIPAIKRYRDRTGAGLREAKEAVEALEARER